MRTPCDVECFYFFCTFLADNVPQQGRTQHAPFPLVIDHRVVEFRQRLHPPFYRLYTNVQDAYTVKTEHRNKAFFVGDRMCGLGHNTPYPLHAVDDGGESVTWEHCARAVAPQSLETIKGSSVGGEGYREPNALCHE